LSTFGVGGDELLVINRQHFTGFRGFPFAFNAFARFIGVVTAVKIIVLAVKTNKRAAKTTHAAVEEVVATFAGTSAMAKITPSTPATTRAAAKITSSALAETSSAVGEVCPAFQTTCRRPTQNNFSDGQRSSINHPNKPVNR
jgi:hypothetical protein